MRWLNIVSHPSLIPPLVVALGDPAGIGPEIIAKAWAARASTQSHPFFVVGDAQAVSAVWDGPVVTIQNPAEAIGVFADSLPVLQLEVADRVTPGRACLDGARAALAALEQAVGLTRSGAASALVTGPVNKAQLYSIGFTHPGQTEFIAERCGIAADNVVMMLAGPTLRVVPMTTHIPLAQVAASISIETIIAQARVTVRGMQRNFGIEFPRLAFAGFNPHAGEDGTLGREEIDIIAPAIALLRDEGINATGPFAADGLFHARARANYDVAMCVYHDQALIPLKTLHFDEGVNLTLGLPIVRTSPDHGTAYDIAGQDRANPGAMIAAIAMAGAMARARAAQLAG